MIKHAAASGLLHVYQAFLKISQASPGKAFINLPLQCAFTLFQV